MGNDPKTASGPDTWQGDTEWRLRLHRLLTCARGCYSGLKGEQMLSASVASALRQWSLDGRLNAVFTKVPNEGKRSPRYAGWLKAMGLIPGASDFVFTWGTGGGWIELKVDNKPLQPNQETFFAWAERTGCHTAQCNSVHGVETALREWGVLV
ncbi:MAG: hypothetical protein CMM93_07960 [Rickettsiales bacterium]|nr:hypothetical protein [Rickettsiales bacterium]|tara:strand:+ start:429 stop:887 length:459 start_codon:yes stop_codon:yes gene_type:complete